MKNLAFKAKDLPEPSEFFKYWSHLAATDPKRHKREMDDAIRNLVLTCRPENQQNLFDLVSYLDIANASEVDQLAKAKRSFVTLFNYLNANNGEVWRVITKD